MIREAREPQRAVLVVDDDAAIRGVVRQALEEEGWHVLEAANGAAALAAYERSAVPVALVLLDLTMPVMNGAQFAEQYWGRDGSTGGGGNGGSGRAPLVIFTAEHGVEAAVQAERLRAVGFLTKPFELGDLLEMVARCARPNADGQEEAELAPSLPSSNRTETGMAGTESVSKGMAARLSAKVAREEWERQRQMDRLRAQLGQLQQDMGKVRQGVSEVAQIELSRRLTREEARRASQLRMESERLRYELQMIRDEFFRLKDEHPRHT